MKRELVVATCQFPISGSVAHNQDYIVRLLTKAKQQHADIAHFAESSLSGYPSVDIPHIHRDQQPQLLDALAHIGKHAADLNLWAIMGGHHYGVNSEKPYNCLWVIDAQGTIHTRYDKRFCMGEPDTLEHAHFRPGTRPVTFTIKDVTCGLLICHEWRYPELYREQKRLGVDVLFHSWYEGNLSAESYANAQLNQSTLVPGTARGRAANNHFWISGSNTSARESCFPSFVARPDGRIVQQAKRNVTGLIITRIDPDKSYDDPSAPWRERAMAGILHNDVLDERVAG